MKNETPQQIFKKNLEHQIS